jgi:hypothetical protein
VSLKGLKSITSLRGTFAISNNFALPNLDGLESFTAVNGENAVLQITGNASLSNIDALSALTLVSGRTGSVTISNNPSLLNLNGLSSLRDIAGGPSTNLEISNNATLQNVDGLLSLVLDGAQLYLTLTNNPQLARCCGLYNALYSMTTCICGLHITISGNGAGCTKDDILAGGPCPGSGNNRHCIGPITLRSQAEVNAFPATYSCTEILGGPGVGGDLRISGADITNLDSLHLLTKVEGDLLIDSNGQLTNFNGLKGLTTVGGMLLISNNTLITNLDGLQVLTSIGASPFTDRSLVIVNNPALTSLKGLKLPSSITKTVAIANNVSLQNLDQFESLTEIAYDLQISGNTSLANIDGLRRLVSIRGMLNIANNKILTNLDGLSSLVSIGMSGVTFESLVLTGNPALTNMKGFKSLTSIHGDVSIENNVSLPNLNGLESLSDIAGTKRMGNFIIDGNTSLTNVDGLSGLHAIGGGDSYIVTISNNPSLTNLHGLSTLTSIYSGLSASLVISNNASLTNVDGLLSLSISSVSTYLTVINNPNLVRGCGLYPILHNAELKCPVSYEACLVSIITGNGAGFTKAEILAGGPCPGSAQPTNLLITAATAHGMKVSFTPATVTPSGYITLLRAFGSPYPEDVPVDGTVYHVGNVIGLSTLVVSIGNQTSFDVTSLIPNTKYYLDVFSFNSGYDYITDNPLAGSQQTTPETVTPPVDPTVQPTNLQFSDITNASMTVTFTAPVPAPSGYITLMEAFSSPFPEDVPLSGRYYHVGGIIGSSTIVVGYGSSTSLNIVSLIPETNYYFNIYSYQLPETGGPQYAVVPLEGNQSTTFSNSLLATRNAPFPNPFNEEITIPFTVKSENTFVQIAIYNQIGNKIADVGGESYSQGYHELKWDRTDSRGIKVTQGLYMYSIRTSESKHSLSGTLVAK